MKGIRGVVMACALLASSAAVGAQPASRCGNSPAMSGMRERVEVIRSQMDRIERKAENPAEQRTLMKLHMQHMQDGMREIRRRELGTDCRVELMNSVMEQMMRHQHAIHEREVG